MTIARYPLPGPAFAPLGRQNADSPDCALWWPGTGARFQIACAQLEVEVEAPETDFAPWLAVTADGAPIARFVLLPGRHRYPVLAGMDPDVSHEIALLRDTQPTGSDAGPVILRAVYTDGTPAPAAPKRRLVEFIGDSLTVGEGCLGPVTGMEWRMAWIAHQCAYPALAARLLDADERVVAMGGWGCWRSWDGDESCRIGRIYDRLCAVVPGGDVFYDFARPADAVVIGLGTNDATALSARPALLRARGLNAIGACARDLIAQVRRRNPGAAILWCYGMLGDALSPTLRDAVEAARQAGDDKVAYLALEDCGADRGAREHPGRASHQKAARTVAEALLPMLEGR